MALMAIGALGLGSVFGSYEVSVVAFTQAAGQSGASGLVLGLWALGSMAGGIAFGSRHWRVPLPRQVLVLTGLLTIVLIPAPFLASLPALAVGTVLGGVAIAPSLIAIFSLTERLVPPAQLTEGLSWTNSGLALGFAGGTALGGILIDGHGTSWGFALTIGSAAMAFVVAAAGQTVLTGAAAGRPQPDPAIAWVDDPLPGPRAGGVRDDPSSPGKS
jgi:MFS family permease